MLKYYGVEIILADKRDDCTNQINTCDIAFVIGNSFVVSPMKEKERLNEHYALETVIKSFDHDCAVYYPQIGIIEGGDIIIDQNKIFVEVSQRTNKIGLKWLNDQFSKKYNIIPLYLKSGFLHLDVVFNILSSTTALIYNDGLTEESLESIKKYHVNITSVEQNEQINFPTNVFSIDENTLVVDRRNIKTNKKIRDTGKTLIELNFSEISKIGGSFRCSTCPLERD